MTRRSSRRSSVAVRRAVLGLMLGIPLIGAPVLAQETPPSDADTVEAEEVVEETVVEEAVAEEAVVEQPRVLISEVLIEGIEGHPEEERLQISTMTPCRCVRACGSPGRSCKTI